MLHKLMILGVGVLLAVTLVLCWGSVGSMGGEMRGGNASPSQGKEDAVLTTLITSTTSNLHLDADKRPSTVDEVEHDMLLVVCLFSAIIALLVAVWVTRKRR